MARKILTIKPSAEKALVKLSPELFGRALAALVMISIHPHAGKKLVGSFAGYFSFNALSCRIVYRIFASEIVVAAISKEV